MLPHSAHDLIPFPADETSHQQTGLGHLLPDPFEDIHQQVLILTGLECSHGEIGTAWPSGDECGQFGPGRLDLHRWLDISPEPK